MNDISLCHDGVKGMKWGVRRYADKNGKLTDAGKKRLERDRFDNDKNNNNKNDGEKKSSQDPSRWVKEDLERGKLVVTSTGDLVKKASDLSKKLDPKLDKKKMDLNNMTDQQLRERINRTNLERQYNDMFGEAEKANISNGKKFLDKTLGVAGTILTLGGSALSIALALKELKG